MTIESGQNQYLENSRELNLELENKVRDLEAIYSEVLSNRRALGKKTAGLEDDVFKTEFGLFGSIQLEECISLMPHFNFPEDGKAKVLDLGSGSARLILFLAILKPNLQKIVGIEGDKDLHDMSLEVLQKAEELTIVAQKQIDLLRGNFFDVKFNSVVKSSDRVFYYLSSSHEGDEEKITDLIGENLTKPSSRFIAFGDAVDPFPDLVKNYGFTLTTEELVNVYTKNTTY